VIVAPSILAASGGAIWEHGRTMTPADTTRPGESAIQPAPGVPAHALLAAILDTSDDAILGQDPAGRVTSWNRAAERLFGHRGPEILGRAVVELFPDHLRAELRATFATVLAGDRVSHLPSEILRTDGMPVPISLSICPVQAVGAEGPGSVVIARDITEQRLAQATLAEIEVRVRESEALAHVGSWLWDLRTGTVQWSDEFHRIHGVDPLDFEGTLEAHLAAVHPDDVDRVRAEMDRSVASGRPFDDEYRVVRPNGDERRLRARAQPQVGSAGGVVGLRGIGQDITDRLGREDTAGDES